MKSRLILTLIVFALAAAHAQIGGGLMFPGPGSPSASAPASPIPSGENFWYSADCITYTSSVCGVPSTGTSISAWADRSGNGNNLSKTGGTCTFNTGQINSQSAVVFTSSCAWALGTSVGPGPGAWTIFVVMKTNASTGNNNFIGCVADDGCPIYYTSSHQGFFAASGGNVSGTAAQDTSWHQLNVQFRNSLSGNTYAFRRDRAADGSGSPGFNVIKATSTVSNEAGSVFLAGSLAEMIYYNSALTGTQITQVETYLNTKYGL